jgi:hypothetical protein
MCVHLQFNRMAYGQKIAYFIILQDGKWQSQGNISSNKSFPKIYSCSFFSILYSPHVLVQFVNYCCFHVAGHVINNQSVYLYFNQPSDFWHLIGNDIESWVIYGISWKDLVIHLEKCLGAREMKKDCRYELTTP